MILKWPKSPFRMTFIQWWKRNIIQRLHMCTSITIQSHHQWRQNTSTRSHQRHRSHIATMTMIGLICLDVMMMVVMITVMNQEVMRVVDREEEEIAIEGRRKSGLKFCCFWLCWLQLKCASIKWCIIISQRWVANFPLNFRRSIKTFDISPTAWFHHRTWRRTNSWNLSQWCWSRLFCQNTRHPHWTSLIVCTQLWWN